MKKIWILALLPLILMSCGAGNTNHRKSQKVDKMGVRSTVEPLHYTYRILATHPHSRTAYTQGLEWHDGTMWEGTGQTGESRLQQIDLKTGHEKVLKRLPKSEFGEGITLFNGLIYQLTWQDNKCYVYDQQTLEEVKQHRYLGEGWGLTHDTEHLYMSDGTDKIRILNPSTFREEGHLYVTHKGEDVQYLNELEWIDGRIWANVYTTNIILIIHPQTGVVEGVIDLEGLLPEEDYTSTTDVLNGIAWDATAKRLFVTGKNWPKLFEIEIIQR